MRYNHESYLPIGAFQPILGRMTLHGGGGGGILDTFSDIIGTGGGDQGLLNIVDEGVQAIGGGLAEVDDFVNEEIPGGWLLPAAIAIAVATGYVDPTLFAAEAGAEAAGTAAFTGASETGLATLAGEGAAADIAGNVLLSEAGLAGAAETVTPEIISKAAENTLANVPQTVSSEIVSAPSGTLGEGVKSASSNLVKEATPSFFDSPVDYLTQKATSATDYLANRPLSEMPGDLYGAAKDYYNTSSNLDLARDAATAYGLANIVGSSPEQGKSQAQLDEEEEAKKVYTYGTSTSSGSNYIPKNRINAGNVYSPSAGYRSLNRYADGGEVQHYGIGGKISDAFTRVAQPFEKAILRPIGEAAPFLKDMAPYAGMAAGAMFGNPAMAAGIGGLASGFGKPGGFDMKRALMGGIAAYGMSNLVGGLEAAGQTPLTDSAALPFDAYPDPQNQAGGFYGPSGQTNQLPAANQTFRSPEAVQKGIGNLLQNSNTPEYKNAMSTFTKNAGIYNAGVPLIMGTTGMMGVDEGNELKKEYDRSLMAQQAEEANFNARVLAGKKRAQQAVSENPYRFAMGGAIDDEYGGDDMNTVNGNMQNGFMGYADGGPVTNQEDIDYMIQIENNRREVDPMSDERYSGLLKQNQDYLSTIYGNIYNQPTPQPVAPPPPVVAPSVEPTPLTGAIATPPPPPPPTVAPLDIETVRANANRALDMSEEVQNNIRDSSRAVERAQELIGTASATPPPPVYQSPNATPAGQYMVRNPYGPEPLNAANIYQYQKKKRGYAEGGDVQGYFFGGMATIASQIEKLIAEEEAAKAAEAAKTAEVAKNTATPSAPPPVSNEPTLPPPTFSPRATSSGQYLVSNPYDLEPLSASNIYDYQKKKRGYAEGGVPRFLSGGGDGMSDSIKASIEGTQEARLADGEFVIPADVVSHLGNGSSKAGAKQLYDMMNRVRKARTGNPKQGREIKPTKLMPV